MLRSFDRSTPKQSPSTSLSLSVSCGWLVGWVFVLFVFLFFFCFCFVCFSFSSDLSVYQLCPSRKERMLVLAGSDLTDPFSNTHHSVAVPRTAMCVAR